MGVIEELLGGAGSTLHPKLPDPITDPIDYGNGVLYFDCIREQFAKSLSAWIGKHKEQVVMAVAPNFDSSGSYGTDKIKGYLIVVISKK